MMKISFTISVVCSILSAQSQSAVDSLFWLVGEWEMKRDSVYTEEVWLPPSGNMMIGMSRTISNNRVMEFEFLTIDEDSAANIFYRARPSGQTGASFRLVSSGKGEAVFENLQHDFPQRIIYRRIAGDSLVARIEGIRNGSMRGIDFPYGKKPR